ncbi:MAG: flagellin [Smithellaceae bacterium]|nr:flagellin [Smithellaceae bacterium]
MTISNMSSTSGTKANLISLQSTMDLLNRAKQRFAMGKRGNSAPDRTISYFTAQDHMARANDLSTLKNAMSEAIRTIKVADNTIQGVMNLIQTAKGLADLAHSADLNYRAILANRYNDLLDQIGDMANDASYKGVNLLNGNDLAITFNEDGSSQMTVNGFSADSAGLGIDAVAGDWSDTSTIDDAVQQLDAALKSLRDNSAAMSSSLNIVSARQDFTTNMINTLTDGANQLTEADLNEEGANMLTLQTRQALGTTALSLSVQAAQSVLRLFG